MLHKNGYHRMINGQSQNLYLFDILY